MRNAPVALAVLACTAAAADLGDSSPRPNGAPDSACPTRRWNSERCLMQTGRSALVVTSAPMEPELERSQAHEGTGQAATIHTALYMNELDRVSTRTSKWTGEVIMRHKYRKEDFKNHTAPIEILILDAEVLYKNEVRNWEDSDGNIIMTEHLYVTSSFYGNYDLFPFDQQELTVVVQLQGYSIEEALLVEWPEQSGVRPVDNVTGRNFHTQQFRFSNWSFKAFQYKEFGLSYYKSRAELRVVVSRSVAPYLVTCILIPCMAICFALAAFFLPLSLVVQRVSMSFTSFLAIFVHMKQMVELVPEGVWCWLLTNMVFNCLVLCALLSANIASARMSAEKGTIWISERIDAKSRWLLPMEFAWGQFLLMAFPQFHLAIGSSMVAIVIVTQAWGFVQISTLPAQAPSPDLMRAARGLRTIAEGRDLNELDQPDPPGAPSKLPS